MSNTMSHEAPKGGIRQSMTWVHTWAGLTFGWLLFFVFFTGTAGYFDTEIDRWMQPELPPAETGRDDSTNAAMLLGYLQQVAPNAEQWSLTLPSDRNQPFASVSWRDADVDAGAITASGSRQLDAASGQPLPTARATGGGQLLYQMHWRLHYLSRTYTDWIISAATLFMFVAIIAGVIIHKRLFKDFFTFRPGKGQRSWLDAHNVLSVIALPFHVMITYSGLLFLGFSFMPLVFSAYYASADNPRSEFYGDVFYTPGLTESAGEAAPLVSLDEVIARTEARWGENRIRSLTIHHPGDRNARINVVENIDRTVANGAGELVFDGVDGELLQVAHSANSPAKGIRDLLLGLHEGLFAWPMLRWLYFFAGLLGTGMVGTGLMLWVRKRRQQSARNGIPPRGLVLVEKLNVGTVAGLPVGVAAYFWANRLLPVDMAGRGDWEANAMFLAWLVMLLHAGVRRTDRAWREQFAVGAVAYAALPILNALTTDRHLLQSLPAGDWVFAGFDLTMLALGIACGWLAWRLRAPQPASTVTAIPATEPTS